MDPDGIEAAEVLLLRMVDDAIERMPAAQRDLTLTRMLAGEDSIGIELLGDCLSISLFGDQIWSGTPASLVAVSRGAGQLHFRA